ncbi:hypothetical protein BZL30_4155 [Mycobacterium kansasii]|uniref:Uncharacterized protein n=1 Tax=Mycobacterium kansasii TaxID=1768 RepID=A0A1V3X8V2_MYCKA|nr:hypothetical protein BZL29_5675 [Mycobacterium kansasii]OOK75582.1 hypothetical protein BZL30_4155 [Mycobacterium kansasii]
MMVGCSSLIGVSPGVAIGQIRGLSVGSAPNQYRGSIVPKIIREVFAAPAPIS